MCSFKLLVEFSPGHTERNRKYCFLLKIDSVVQVGFLFYFAFFFLFPFEFKAILTAFLKYFIDLVLT